MAERKGEEWLQRDHRGAVLTIQSCPHPAWGSQSSTHLMDKQSRDIRTEGGALRVLGLPTFLSSPCPCGLALVLVCAHFRHVELEGGC